MELEVWIVEKWHAWLDVWYPESGDVFRTRQECRAEIKNRKRVNQASKREKTRYRATRYIRSM